MITRAAMLTAVGLALLLTGCEDRSKIEMNVDEENARRDLEQLPEVAAWMEQVKARGLEVVVVTDRTPDQCIAAGEHPQWTMTFAAGTTVWNQFRIDVETGEPEVFSPRQQKFIQYQMGATPGGG